MVILILTANGQEDNKRPKWTNRTGPTSSSKMEKGKGSEEGADHSKALMGRSQPSASGTDPVSLEAGGPFYQVPFGMHASFRAVPGPPFCSQGQLPGSGQGAPCPAWPRPRPRLQPGPPTLERPCCPASWWSLRRRPARQTAICFSQDSEQLD